MSSKYIKVLCIPLALLAAGMLRAQDNSGVQVTPPYTPGNENQPSSAARMHVGVESCPREVLIAPRMFGSKAADGAPWAFFRSADPSGFGTIRYNINLRVTEERDQDDPSTYYETPDVNVTGRSDGFRFSGTFDRTYQRDRRRDLIVAPPQDETDRQPPPQLIPPSIPGTPWITGGGPSGKGYVFLDYRLHDLDVNGLRVDEVSNDGIVPGGGIQLSLWGGIVHAGLSYLQGKIQTESVSCHSTSQSGQLYPAPPPSGDVVYNPQGNDALDRPASSTDTCQTTRLTGTVNVWELDLMLTALEGSIDIGNGFALYSQCGPLVSIEYVRVDIDGRSAEGWALSGGAYVEGGVKTGTFRLFTRASANWGWGLGGIDGSSGVTVFSGIEWAF